MIVRPTSASSPPALLAHPRDISPRLQVRAKFFYAGDEKVVLQGVTYGPFRASRLGEIPLPEAAQVRRDFKAMVALGVNAVRVYHVPPGWLLDLASELALRIFITIPWSQRVCMAKGSASLASTQDRVRAAARAHAGHPALLGFFIDNEIPPDLVRWAGARKVEALLDSFAAIIKQEDPGALTAYANFPPTEYLLPSGVDFIAYNVYLHRRSELVSYLARLQNLAGDKPLVLSEFGLDTLRHSEGEQAQLLTGYVTAAQNGGLAGTFIFAWTDEWFTDGLEVSDWAFGIVTRERRPKLSFSALQQLWRDPKRPRVGLPPPAQSWPRVSVIVCAHNGAPTLRSCLKSLEQLAYPDYEVILVDDGSTDATPEIALEFASVQTLRQPVNWGLSAARNLGVAAASGTVIAFTDADCLVDGDWLLFLVRTLLAGDFAAVGGPNLSPPAAHWIQAVVAAAPGAPSHVLLSDTEAEHVPGCNMAFYRWALTATGGFDPEFRQAGDDVDLCWRLLQQGYAIGFSPAAVVWHHRRFAVITYFAQQIGYGRAEALLRYKHLHHFGRNGAALWRGRVYAQLGVATTRREPRIYHGTFALGHFQCVYPHPSSPWPDLFRSLEWLGAILVLLAIGAFFPSSPGRLVPLALLVFPVGTALLYAAQVRIEARFDALPARLLLFYLALAQPWRRAGARYLTWLRGKETPRASQAPSPQGHRPDPVRLAFWSERGGDRTQLLAAIQAHLRDEGWRASPDTGWATWDLQVFASLWWSLRLRTMTEIYPQGRRLTRLENRLRATTFSGLSAAVGLLLTSLLVTRNEQIGGAALSAWLIAALAWWRHGCGLQRRIAEVVTRAAVERGLVAVDAQADKAAGERS